MAPKTRNATVYAVDAIKVEGLKEITRAFGQVSKDLTKEMRTGFKRVAEHVAAVARGNMTDLKHPTGAAAWGIKGTGTNAGASIRFPAGGPESGKDKLGYYPWLDFGGSVGRGRVRSIYSHTVAVQSGARVRPLVKGGRYIYPAIAASSDYISEQAGEIIEDVLGNKHHFKVQGG
jgi:hypothetical protein